MQLTGLPKVQGRGHADVLVLQVSDNAADSVKLRVPCDFKCLRHNAGENCTFWVNENPGKIVADHLIILLKYFYQAFKMHNPGLFLCGLWVSG